MIIRVVAQQKGKNGKNVSGNELPVTRSHESAVLLTHFPAFFSAKSVFFTSMPVFLGNLPRKFSAAEEESGSSAERRSIEVGGKG
jgi:hypothetical protein